MGSTLHRWALLLWLVPVLLLVGLGILWLDVPPIYRFAQHAPVMLYRGYVALGLAGLLIGARRWILGRMLWLFAQFHRWASALFMLSMVGIDAAMHVLNIPHMEGWWLPLVGGGGLIPGVLVRLKHKAAYARHRNCGQNY